MENKAYVDPALRPAGPGAVSPADINPGSALDTATEYEYVDIFNPLTVPFIARFASTRPVNAPVRIVQTPSLVSSVQTERDLASMYGLGGFKNPDREGRANITHDTVIEAGKTKSFIGSEAQVVAKQLINEILSRRDQKLLMGDPTARRQVEDEIVVGRHSVDEIMSRGSVMPTSEQVRQVVEESRYAEAEVPVEEVEFAGLTKSNPDLSGSGNNPEPVRPPEGLDATGRGADIEAKRAPGRPRKSS